jgi:hypothetical protein
MNLRCIYCQTPFTLSRGEMLSAIVSMNEKNQNHYDAHCPRCRRANSISRQRMELFFPNWQEAAKHMPAEEPPVPASASAKTEPVSKSMKEAVAKKLEARKAAKSSAAKKPASAAKKPAAKKTTSTKSTAKKAPAKGKKK